MRRPGTRTASATMSAATWLVTWLSSPGRRCRPDEQRPPSGGRRPLRYPCHPAQTIACPEARFLVLVKDTPLGRIILLPCQSTLQTSFSVPGAGLLQPDILE